MKKELRKLKFKELVEDFQNHKRDEKLDFSSEETIRVWINRLLEIFGWDVGDTSQIYQEKILSEQEKIKLQIIESTNTRPDYTFVFGGQKLAFLDAKNISVNIKDDVNAAFQIKSYGWSVSAPCSFLTNFEEFIIYDCTYIPDKTQPTNFGRIYLKIDEYIDNFDILDEHLFKENIYSGKLNELYLENRIRERNIIYEAPDIYFASKLSEFRLKLAQAILDHNKDLIKNDPLFLSYLTQIIINRIIFIRVCEAKKIEKEGLLKSYQEKDFWNEFKTSSYFEFFDHYDGPLFKKDENIQSLEIPDETFNDLLNLFYYPSPYKFDVIPAKLLSDIYEIFLAKKLYLEHDIVKDKLKSEYSKSKGAVSTPQYIVKDLVERTIKCNENSIAEIFSNNKIIDIACGSGAFLIGAFEYIEQKIIELIKKNSFTPELENYNNLFINLGNKFILTVEGRKAIISNCVFGVDIDIEATEVAKMSLALKTIDIEDVDLSFYKDIGLFGSQILQDVGRNVKCGNSLVSTDILDLYPEIIDNEQELHKTRIFNWNDQFSELFAKNNGFNYIIGNPPYVEVKNYNTDLPTMHKYIKEKFKSSKNGKVDLAIPFIEQALTLLNNNGRVGFIVQKRFFKTDYGKNIRALITENNYLYSVIDFQSNNIFKDKITYVANLILEKQSSSKVLYNYIKYEPELLPYHLNQERRNKNNQVEFDSACFSSSPWDFSDPDVLRLKLEHQVKGCLGDIAKVKVGIQVLWDKVYHIIPNKIENDIIFGKNQLGHAVKVELLACRKLVCNENFYPFRSSLPDAYVIFPYKINHEKVIKLDYDKFCDEFPLAGSYLKEEEALIKTNVETFDNETIWHLYTREQNHNAIYPKVAIPMTSLDTFATVLKDSSTYCDNANVNFLDIPIKEDKYLYAFAGIINSTVFSVFARNTANPQSNGYFKFNKQFLEPIPFPIDTFNANRNNIVEAIAEVAKLIEERQQEYKQASLIKRDTIEVLIKKYWAKLDGLVYNLYGIESPKDKEIFNIRGRSIDRFGFFKGCLNE